MTVLVTAWSRRVWPDMNWEHNHIENGWAHGYTPQGKFESQNFDWENSIWHKEWCFIVPPNNRVLTREAYVRRFLGKMY